MGRISRVIPTAICAAALASGCMRTVEGSALAAQTPVHATVATTTSLPVTAPESLLVTADHVTAVVGGTMMTLVGMAMSTSDASGRCHAARDIV